MLISKCQTLIQKTWLKQETFRTITSLLWKSNVCHFDCPCQDPCPVISFVCQHTGVSINRGTPKSYILIGILHYQPSIVGYPGTPISGHPHLVFIGWLPCRPRPFLSPQRSQMRTWAAPAYLKPKTGAWNTKKIQAVFSQQMPANPIWYIWMLMEIPNDIRS